MKKFCIILSITIIIAITSVGFVNMQNKNFNCKHYNSQQCNQEFRKSIMKKFCIILSITIIIAITSVGFVNMQNKNFNCKHYNSQQCNQEFRYQHKHHKNFKKCPNHNINVLAVQNEVNSFIRANNIKVDESLTPYNSNCYSEIIIKQKNKNHNDVFKKCIQNEVNSFIRANNIKVDESLTPYNSNCYSEIIIKQKNKNHNDVFKKCIKETRKLISYENKFCFDSMFCYFEKNSFYILYK